MSQDQYKLKQQEKVEAREKERRSRKMKKIMKMSLLILAVAVVIFGGFWYLVVSRIGDNPSDELSICVQHARLAMHIHPQLSITIKGEPYQIPADVGISSTCMRPIHTHDATGTLHVEFPYLREVELGDFFKVWGKQFNSNCIFDFCSGSEGELKMFVNGEQNFEFENYVMRDGDMIEIIFE